MSVQVSRELKILAIERCRELRKRQTEAEIVFWNHFRKRVLSGFKIRRQHPIFYNENGITSFYVADFYIHEKKIVIELDGKIHRFMEESDAFREEVLMKRGYNIIRFDNECVLEQIEQVEREILAMLQQRK